jgi:predicted  nucleic acid-binding Zn-ribbon protein
MLDNVGTQSMEHGMSGEPDNVILVYLRRMEEKLDWLTSAVGDLGRRVTSLKTQVVLLHGDFAAQSERIDRIEIRLDRIERRLEIVPA